MRRCWPILGAVALGIVVIFFLASGVFHPEPVYQGKTVIVWMRDMNSPDSLVRSNATVALRSMGPAAVPYLAGALRRRDSILKKPFLSLGPKLPLWVRRSFLRTFKPFAAAYDRLGAVNALAALGTNAPVPPLIKALHDPDKQIASQAATALGRVGRNAVRGLAAESSGNDGYVRLMSCYALSLIGPDASNAVPALIQRLTDSHPNVPALAAHALGQIGRPAVAALGNALKDHDNRIAIQAARVLGGMGPPQGREAAPDLIAAMKDSRVEVRRAAVESLGLVWPFSSESIASLTAALKDSDMEVRANAAGGLARASRFAAPAVAELIEALGDKGAQVRGKVALALGNIGPAAKSALPALQNRLDDQDEFVRTNALEAVRRIESPAVVPPK